MPMMILFLMYAWTLKSEDNKGVLSLSSSCSSKTTTRPPADLAEPEDDDCTRKLC